MIQNLDTLGVKVPGGFAVSVRAYEKFIEHNRFDKRIRELIGNMDANDLVSLRRTGSEVRQIIRNGEWPTDLQEEIKAKYRELSGRYHQEITDVAVRSSATAEDLPDASFAGQQGNLSQCSRTRADPLFHSQLLCILVHRPSHLLSGEL